MSRQIIKRHVYEDLIILLQLTVAIIATTLKNKSYNALIYILFGLNKIIFSERCEKVAYNSEVEQEHPDKVVSHPDSTNIFKTV